MNRYFISHDDDMPNMRQNYGPVTYLPLDAFGRKGADWNLVMLEDNGIPPNTKWYAFPSVLDSKTTLKTSKIPEQVLLDLEVVIDGEIKGITGDETTLEAITIFGAINPYMTV